ncbi:MAG: hypothetical protein JWO05_3518 [Gemmatimonadetes bacterium]|nr:hypothetical protein [Gemmatimonadota bacterium]
MTRRILASAFAACLIVAGVVSVARPASAAQEGSRAYWGGSEGIMRMALIQLVKQQERHMGASGSYATSMAELPSFRTNPALTVTLEYAKATGFGARVRHKAFPGRSCIVRDGLDWNMRNLKTDKSGKFTDEELQVSCDDFR